MTVVEDPLEFAAPIDSMTLQKQLDRIEDYLFTGAYRVGGTYLVSDLFDHRLASEISKLNEIVKPALIGEVYPTAAA